MASQDRAEVAYTFGLINSGEGPRLVILEPWGDQFPLPSGETLEIRARGPVAGQTGDGRLQVELRPDGGVTMRGWVGSIVELYYHDQEV